MTCPLKTIASARRNRPRADRGELIADRGGLDRVRKSDRVVPGASPACKSRLGARPSIYEHVRVLTRTRENVLLWVFRPSP